MLPVTRHLSYVPSYWSRNVCLSVNLHYWQNTVFRKVTPSSLAVAYGCFRSTCRFLHQDKKPRRESLWYSINSHTHEWYIHSSANICIVKKKGDKCIIVVLFPRLVCSADGTKKSRVLSPSMTRGFKFQLLLMSEGF